MGEEREHAKHEVMLSLSFLHACCFPYSSKVYLSCPEKGIPESSNSVLPSWVGTPAAFTNLDWAGARSPTWSQESSAICLQPSAPAHEALPASSYHRGSAFLPILSCVLPSTLSPLSGSFTAQSVIN